MANFTTKLLIKLTETINASPTGTVEVFFALNIFLSITASLGNALILIALHKRRKRRNVSSNAWRSLIFALDLLYNHFGPC